MLPSRLQRGTGVRTELFGLVARPPSPLTASHLICESLQAQASSESSDYSVETLRLATTERDYGRAGADGRISLETKTRTVRKPCEKRKLRFGAIRRNANEVGPTWTDRDNASSAGQAREYSWRWRPTRSISNGVGGLGVLEGADLVAAQSYGAMESEEELSEVQKRIRALNQSAAASKPRKGNGGNPPQATGKLRDNPFVSNDCPAPSPRVSSGGDSRSFRTSGYSPAKPSSEPVATRYNFSPSSTNRTSPAQPAAVTHSSPTAKSQLFKTARLLQKMSFESETESSIVSQTHENNSAGREEEPGEMNTATSGESEEELDASAALKYWKNRGVSKDGPISFRDAKKIDLKPSISTNRTKIEEDAGPRMNAAPGLPGGLQSENSSQASSQLPLPPDIFRTVQVQSAEATYQEGEERGRPSEDRQEETEKYRTADGSFTASAVDSPRDPSTWKDGEAEGASPSKSAQYCAYGKRSRLRSHRPAAGNNESIGDHDVASVVSSSTIHSNTSQLTSNSQLSSLSSRATRFLRDKRKGGVLTGGNANSSSTTAAYSESTEANAKDVTHNMLRDKVSNNKLKQRLASPSPLPEEDEMKDGGAMQITTESPFDESQTKDNPMGATVPESHAENIAGHAYQSIRSSNQQYTMLSSLPPRVDDAPSAASSMGSGNNSKLKANDRLDSDIEGSAAKAASPPNKEDALVPPKTDNSSNDEGGCKPLEMLGPLSEIVETAYNVLSPANIEKGLFPMSDAVSNDAPSDEDIAIEVEYVEQHEAEDPSFVTETDGTGSMYTESTRDSSFM